MTRSKKGSQDKHLPFLMLFQESDPNPSVIEGVYDQNLQMWVSSIGSDSINLSNSTSTSNTTHNHTTKSTWKTTTTFGNTGQSDTDNDFDTESDFETDFNHDFD